MDSLRRGVHGLYRSFACPDAEDQPEPEERNDPAGSDRTTAKQGYSLSVKAGDVDMKAPVNIQARNEELQAVVDRIFAGQGVNCIINDKSILITKVPSQPSAAGSPQESTVTGQVKGPNGLPLVGVTVLIDGTMVGTTTDASGNFRIRAKSGDTLVFSYIGYDERREKVGAGRRST